MLRRKKELLWNKKENLMLKIEMFKKNKKDCKNKLTNIVLKKRISIEKLLKLNSKEKETSQIQKRLVSSKVTRTGSKKTWYN